MKTLLKLEDAAKLIGAYLLTLYFGNNWWIFFALLFLPDLSMLGYLINAKWGAALYNIFHHYATAIALLGTGLALQHQNLILIGSVLFGHIAMDRLMGYGLKYEKGFKYTHLGEIGRKKE